MMKPSPTTPPAKITTSINPYVPPVYYGQGLIPDPMSQSVKQGKTASVAVVINAADGAHPRGPRSAIP